MANLKVKNGAGADAYLKASGAGTDDDPLVPVHDIDGTVPVSGPLTDDELRASAVPVSGPLTDDELRASAVPVSGPLTNTELRAVAVPVSGALTNVELRALAVDVAGPLTNTELRAAAIDVNGPLTNTQLRASAVPVSGPLTDDELRASAVPVSGPLTDDELRASPIDVAIAERTVTTVTGTVATSGSNTIVAAPGVGQRIVLDEIFVQLEASTPTVVLVQNSAATIWRLRLVADGDHALWSFPEGKEHRLFENGALVLNLSGANQVGYTARYRLETV